MEFVEAYGVEIVHKENSDNKRVTSIIDASVLHDAWGGGAATTFINRFRDFRESKLNRY